MIKQKGFTLIEIIIVMAIISILSVVFITKIAKHVEDVKKTKVIEQARQIRMAVVTYEMLSNEKFSDIEVVGSDKNTVKAALNFSGTKKYLKDVVIDKLKDEMSLDTVYKIVEDRAEFSIDSSGSFKELIGNHFINKLILGGII
ncbi:prepilin-type N-terminal cleavage/methylation domain-containing protein [Clostridium baratii]|uniref:prepilin-type N-terminal cleavage/methylation domain-containing protein n=1 Tax=Clostridium baratii TaxID=1561 RepID=UPI0030CBEE71